MHNKLSLQRCTRHKHHVHLPSKVSLDAVAWICRRVTDKRSPRLPWIPKGAGSTKKGPMKPLLSTPMLGCNTWIRTILCVCAPARCAAPGPPASLPSGGGAARVLNSRLRAPVPQRGQRWRSLARTPGRSQFRGCCGNGPCGGDRWRIEPEFHYTWTP